MAIKYLTNKDLLEEIHKSKNSFCSFLTPEDKEYDIILNDVSEITEETILAAKENQIQRLKKDDDGEKVVEVTDLVFRVMTWEHIPIVQPKSKNKKSHDFEEFFGIEFEEEYEDDPEIYISKTNHVKLNFPPFFHYRLDENNQPFVVAKSHWKGSVDSGHFSKTHGRMTEKLGMMFVKLCEKYSTRSNWRNYTYVDEMRGDAILQLTQVGLKFDESKSQNPFAYMTQIIHNCFTRVLNNEKRSQNIRDDILEINGLNPSWSRQSEQKPKD